MTKRVLVAGGAGFLGSFLCEKLLSQGVRVVCLDNLQTGSEENISHLKLNHDFEFREFDIINSISPEKFDEIYNLACPASPVHYQSDPIRTWKTSVFGTYNLLELAKYSNALFLQASTSEVYGDPIEHPQKEEHWGNVNPCGIRSCYDEGKRSAESLVLDFHRQHSIEVRVARIFNTFGPRMDKNDGRIISNFINQALAGEDLTIYGDGLQTRSICYVDDLIEGILSLSKSDYHYPVNIGNPEEMTVKEIGLKVLELTKSNSNFSYFPLPEDDPKQRKPDISLIRELCGWQPKVSPEEGIKKTIEFFRSIQ